MNLKVVALGVLAVGTVIAGTPATAAGNLDREESIEKIKTEDLGAQRQGLNEILSGREHIVAALTDYIRNANRKAEGPARSSIVTAIEVLGEIRAVDAIDDLVEFIDFPRSLQTIIRGHRRVTEIFPAGKALINIGRPSVNAIIDALETKGKSEDVFLFNCRWIVSQIEGGRLAAQNRLKFDFDNESDPERRARIHRLLKYVSEGIDQ